VIKVECKSLGIDLMQRLLPSVRRNWEASGGYADLDFDVDWGMYLTLQERGILKVFVATEGGEIAGYLWYIISPGHPHDRKVPFAIQDTFFVEHAYRKKGVALKLMTFAEGALRQDGIGVVTQAAKPGSEFNRVLERKGYEHTENMYLKRL